MFIGISGNNGAGKDTFAAFLEAALQRKGLRIKRKAFADTLYVACGILYGMQPKSVYDREPARKNDLLCNGLTVRETLIQVGAALCDIHADTFTTGFDRLHHLIFTDVRFDNEAALCDMLFHVRRDGQTENVGKEYGDLILNNGDLSDLERKADEVSCTVFQFIHRP